MGNLRGENFWGIDSNISLQRVDVVNTAILESRPYGKFMW
jgi:hypothetical protein